VIGYGSGMTARVLHDAGFRALDIAELSADIARLADRHFGDLNERVRTRPGVHTYITDGRNLLLLQDHRYDLVSMEVTSIWFAGAASLYNRDFYRLVKSRLADDGVLQQWVQLHNLYPQDLLYVLGSVRAEFRYLWVYEIGGQGIIIASDSPNAAPRPEYLELLNRSQSLRALAALYGGSFDALNGKRLLDPDGVDRLLAGFGPSPDRWVSTDDNLILEYSTPRGNALDGERSFRVNMELLRGHATPR
jgi:spermidine synthase